MSVIVECTVPTERFALAETLDRIPGMFIEIERLVAQGPDQIMPYFWASRGNHEAFETAARNDPSVHDLVKLDEFNKAVLYRAVWVQNVETVAYAYTETGAVLLNAMGHDREWELQLRFDDENSVSKFSGYVHDNDFEIDITRLYRPSRPFSKSQLALTEAQHETIIAALEGGYYENPRGITRSELAEEFGISQQALSARIRRAHRLIMENVFTITPPDDE
ncbi:helix-turn-helix domain-containing protein [Halalkalicoccus tibetensis]|uniref:Helix-turn-helix domain-containing protein n=1 Tax=Halalkalicoccus tibetensis TaxID=175632 RepID=A0ABD5V6S9_9EURY